MPNNLVTVGLISLIIPYSSVINVRISSLLYFFLLVNGYTCLALLTMATKTCPNNLS